MVSARRTPPPKRTIMTFGPRYSAALAADVNKGATPAAAAEAARPRLNVRRVSFMRIPKLAKLYLNTPQRPPIQRHFQLFVSSTA
jgi:hypothetical protein